MEKDELLAQLRPLLSVPSIGEGTPASPRETEVVDPTPQGWSARGTRLLTLPDTLSGRIGVFPSWTPDRKLVGPAQGTIEVLPDRIVVREVYLSLVTASSASLPLGSGSRPIRAAGSPGYG